MTDSSGSPPLRVEQALRLLPDLEVLAPLRALVVSTSLPDERKVWASSGPYLTVGKRAVQPAELRRRATHVFHQLTRHVNGLYDCYVKALEAQQRGDTAGAVSGLLGAGEREERVGRVAPSKAWYEVARQLAVELQDRQPEIDALRRLGDLCLTLGQYAEGARHYQRSMVLAEAEVDQAGAIAACQGLGRIALEQGEWDGAHAWFVRGLRLAEAASDEGPLTGRIEHQLGELARRRGDLPASLEHLRRAQERFEHGGEAAELARVMISSGKTHMQMGNDTAALGAYREALAWARRARKDPDLEIGIRLDLAALHLETGKYLDAATELRRAEDAAMTRNLVRRLIQIYTLLGRLHGEQNDESGFVFFEQAIELCRTLDPTLIDRGHVYHEYGLFRSRFGAPEEARAYLERAREVFESLGEGSELEQVRTALKQLV